MWDSMYPDSHGYFYFCASYSQVPSEASKVFFPQNKPHVIRAYISGSVFSLVSGFIFLGHIYPVHLRCRRTVALVILPAPVILRKLVCKKQEAVQLYLLWKHQGTKYKVR